MIIAIGHRKRTGKDKFARFLAEALRGTSKMAFNKKPVTIIPMAYSLKAAVAQMYPGIIFDYDRYEDEHPNKLDKDTPIAALNGRSARQVWLDVGRLVGKYDPPIFARTVTVQAPRDQNGRIHGHVITPDLRRSVEVEHFMSPGPAVFVRVDRFNNGHQVIIPDGGTHTLEEELAEWAGWHVIIRNDGDLGHLHDKAQKLAGLLKDGLPSTCIEL